MRRLSRRLAALLTTASLALALAASSAIAAQKLFHTGAADELALARTISRQHLQTRLQKHGIASIDDLRVKKVKVDELSMAHTRVQQTYKGVPVFGGEAIVHLNQDGTVFAVTDNLVGKVRVATEPTLTRKEAIDAAVQSYGCRDCLTAKPTTSLWVLRLRGQDHLVYRVRLERLEPAEKSAKPVVFVDAHSGKVVSSYDDLKNGSGPSLYSGVISGLATLLYNGSYYLEDVGRKLGTFDSRQSQVQVYRYSDANDVWDSSTQRAGVDVHYGSARFFDYWLNVHGRNGIDGSGGPLYYASANGATGLMSSLVHYGRRWNNAQWTGSYMRYGDGDGTTFSPLVTLDIVGHEMTHGITQFEADLVYQNESGALNESWSDVFGAMLERHVRGESGNTWKIGEQCYTPANGTGDALRYMDNPHAASNAGYTADDDPDHYSERYTGTGDGGGVHINSGIANKAFHLLAAGGAHHRGGSMAGIGADKAAAIWYKALSTYMTSTTNFAGARVATINAANALYGSGSSESSAVAQAWSLVGVN